MIACRKSIVIIATCPAILSLFGCTRPLTTASPSGSEPIFVIPDAVETRWASPENWKGEKGVAAQAKAGRKGSPCFPLKKGESKVLADVTGQSGTVRRIWITINDRSPEMLRGIKIEMFWDGADKPAVSAPIGDFFGQTLGRMTAYQNAFFASPEARSFNCYIPMPFKTGMKIVATNETGTDQRSFYYDVDYTLGDSHPANTLYFHACFRRENPTKMQSDYEILPKVTGRGRFLGANVGVIADTGRWHRSWWGEGEVKVYLDGDEALPTLCGTGTEDYIGTGWGQGQYAHMYQGCPLADGDNYQYGFYRLHVPDPIYFRTSVRATIQQIGCWSPETIPQFKESKDPEYIAGPGQVEIDWSKIDPKSYGLFERTDDWSSCAYFYLDRPTSDAPPIPPVAARIAGLGVKEKK